jgi:hypothetical protein
MTWLINQKVWAYKVQEILHLGVGERKAVNTTGVNASNVFGSRARPARWADILPANFEPMWDHQHLRPPRPDTHFRLQIFTSGPRSIHHLGSQVLADQVLCQILLAVFSGPCSRLSVHLLTSTAASVEWETRWWIGNWKARCRKWSWPDFRCAINEYY